jgi:DNA-binding GntR family transcriptional regulator
MLESLKLGDRENFTTRVHKQLREALMAGRFWPGQRLRIGELATAMGVSQTPVREAIMQLAREGGLEIRSSQSITVTNLSLARYKELREVRMLLEGLATEKATPLMTSSELTRLAELHDELIRAEQSGDAETATLANFHFHFLIYRAARATDLVALLESVWLRNGPLLKYLYPHAPPTYPGQHQHLTLMEALRRRDPAAARQAVQDDMMEGGVRLVELMGKIETGEAAVVDGPDGLPRLTFRAAVKRKTPVKEAQV